VQVTLRRYRGLNLMMMMVITMACTLALIRQHLVSISKIAISTYHLWATTDFDNARIINDDALHCHPPGLRNIIWSLQDPTTAEYVWAPLAPGITRITMLLANLRQSTIDLSSITLRMPSCPDSDLLLHRRSATDTTGIENRIRLMSPLPHTLHNFKSMYVHVLC
jgi:hypothetical protein